MEQEKKPRKKRTPKAVSTPEEVTPKVEEAAPKAEETVTSDMQDSSEWLDSILGMGTAPKELTPDELAMSAAGLTAPEDAELERILSEDWDSVPDLETLESVDTPAPAEAVEDMPSMDIDATQAFTVHEQPEAEEVVPEEPVKKNSARTNEESSPVRKTRPSAKKGYGFFGLPHLATAIIWLSIAVIIGVTLGRAFWAVCTDLMAFGKESSRITITITEQDLNDPDAIAEILGDAGLVKYPDLFKFFYNFKLSNSNKDRAEEDKIQTLISTGTFTLNSAFDYNALIQAMGTYAPTREEIEVTIPEGYNCAQIFALLEKKGVCTVAELEEYAANGDVGDYWFLEGVERGHKYSLEGYLFPDTYRFYTNDSPRNALRKMLNGFDYRFTNRMKDKYEAIKEDTGLTLHEIVTLASMVEKETANDAESFDISSVFHNRLANSSQYPWLDCDATIYYALGDYFGEHGALTYEDMEIDSPYNTSSRGPHMGLPIGPITNPGSNSLEAALEPNDTNYYFYVYNPSSGSHLFASNIYDHNDNIDRVS